MDAEGEIVIYQERMLDRKIHILTWAGHSGDLIFLLMQLEIGRTGFGYSDLFDLSSPGSGYIR